MGSEKIKFPTEGAKLQNKREIELVEPLKLLSMPNWCFASYVIEGEKKEIDKLELMMRKLDSMEKPAVENGFGTKWLGCLVHEMGGNWEEVRCRGSWSELERVDDCAIRFNTETAWAPCNETLDLICKRFPSLRYYYSSEEPGMCEYWTNDEEGKYFPDRFYIDLCTPEEQYDCEYFRTLEDALRWMRENYSKNINSKEDIDRLCDKWEEESPDAFCYLYEYKIDKD